MATSSDRPNALLARSLQRLLALPWLRATFRYRFDPPDTAAVDATGRWEELTADGRRLSRLELRFPIGGEPFEMLQVNDGRFLWEVRRLDTRTYATRIDLQRVATAAATSDDDGPGGPTPSATFDLGTGGLTGLLAAIGRRFDFDRAQAGWLHQAGRRLSVWRVEGRLNDASRRRAGLPVGGESGSESTPTDRLPPMLPDQVVLLHDRDTLWPRRIELRQSTTVVSGAAGPDGENALTPTSEQQAAGRLLAVIEATEVASANDSLRPPDRRRFTVDPSSQPFRDETERYLRTE